MRRRVLRVKLQALDFKTAQREGRAGEAYGSQRNGSKRTSATPTRLSIHSVEARRPAASPRGSRLHFFVALARTTRHGSPCPIRSTNK